LSEPDLQDIVGQDEAIARLQRYMRGGRAPHAMLFEGPDGVGRRTTAVALAKGLLCHSPRGVERSPSAGQPAHGAFIANCGRCDDCRMMAAGTHPDFHPIYKELARYHDDPDVRGRVMQELGIEVIRSFLIAPAGLTSARGKGKVFVVLEAELMSGAAQNALLKTLEEPPSDVTIILVCQRLDSLLPTTLSRCAAVRFGPLPRQFVKDRLMETGVDQEQAEFWTSFTDGSLGRAIELAGRDMYPVKCKLVDKLAEGGGGLGEQFSETADKLAAAEVSQTKKSQGADLSKTLASRRAAGLMLELIAGAYRDALVLVTGCGSLAANADQAPAVEAIAGRFSAGTLAGIIESLSRYEQLLWRNVSPRLVWDNVALTCASGQGPDL